MAAAAAAIYVVILIIDPLLEPGREVMRAHPEDYAAGRWGLLVNASYVAFAIALAVLTLELFRIRGWRAAAAGLLLPPAVLCVFLAADPLWAARAGGWASAAVFSLALGPLAISATAGSAFDRWRGWRWALAALTLAAFAALMVAPESISGVVNRLFDLLAAAWVVLTGLALRTVR